MRFVSWDTETHLIKQGNMMPRLVCISWAERSIASEEESYCDSGQIAYVKDGIARGLFSRTTGLSWLRQQLNDDNVTLVGHNIAFDLGVVIAADPSLLLSVFVKYRKGLIHDTQIRQQLIDIATGELKFHEDEDGEIVKSSYHLADLSQRLLKKWLKKKDTWRLRYGELDGVPLPKWPEEASKYAIEDAVTTLQVHEKQEEIAGGPIPNSEEQHRAAWALHLMSAWGLRTDGAAVAKLKASLEHDYAEMMNALRPSGLLNITPSRILKSGPRRGQREPEKISKFMRAIKARVAAAYQAMGEACPQTEGGDVATDKKTLKATKDPDLVKLAEAGAIGKLLQTYVPVLESGTRVPINPRYNVLVETGRTSCSKPNIQNPPRKGGVRECFIPRDGWVYAFSDYDTLELRALSQACLDILGRSEMAEALRRGEDLHLSLAAEMLGISMEEAKRRFDEGDAEVKEYRQQAKPANFGYPGGMSAESFKEYAEGYGINLTSEQAAEIRDTWFRKWPEMRPYFDAVSVMTETDAPVQQLRSGRIRGGASFCAVANGFFQGLAADGAKEALWRVALECYVDKESPLYGCRPVFFIHDEIGIEIPLRAWGMKRAAAAADRLSAVMIEAMEKWIPDVPISAKPIMVRRWFKGAEPVRLDGMLVPCKPVTTEKDGKKKTTWATDIDEPMRAAA